MPCLPAVCSVSCERSLLVHESLLAPASPPVMPVSGSAWPLHKLGVATLPAWAPFSTPPSNPTQPLTYHAPLRPTHTNAHNTSNRPTHKLLRTVCQLLACRAVEPQASAVCQRGLPAWGLCWLGALAGHPAQRGAHLTGAHVWLPPAGSTHPECSPPALRLSHRHRWGGGQQSVPQYPVPAKR